MQRKGPAIACDQINHHPRKQQGKNCSNDGFSRHHENYDLQGCENGDTKRGSINEYNLSKHAVLHFFSEVEKLTSFCDV